jgi:hypothetical protein
VRRSIFFTLVVVVGLGACGGSTAIREAAPTTSPSTTSTPAPARYEVTTTVLQSAEHGPQLCLGGVLDSFPPQCGGPDVIGWRWANVPGVRTGGATTWVDSVHVVGTFDGRRFTLTQPPSRPTNPPPPIAVHFPQICAHPTGVDTPSEQDLTRTGGLNDVPGLVSLWVTGPNTGTPGPRFVVNATVRPGFADQARAAIRRSYAAGLCLVEKDAPTEAELREVQAKVDALGSHTPLGIVLGAGIDPLRSVVTVHVARADDAATRFARQRFGDLVVLDGALMPVK